MYSTKKSVREGSVRPCEVDVFDVRGVEAELFEDQLEKALLRIRVEGVGVVVEAKVAWVPVQDLAGEEQALPVLG